MKKKDQSMFLRPDKCVYMLHIELGFLLHDFIQDSLWGFVSKYSIEQTIFIQHEIEWVPALFECGFLAWNGVSGLGNINFTDLIILWEVWSGHSMLLSPMHSWVI